jgi:DNA polymerase elongation subunit (family B)
VSKTEEEYNGMLNELKNGLGFSPLTGEIVVIGVLDYEKEQGVIYYQSPNIKAEETKDGNFRFKPMKESEMLESFWQGIQNYDEIITFNGRSFDIPYIIARSAK